MRWNRSEVQQTRRITSLLLPFPFFAYFPFLIVHTLENDVTKKSQKSIILKQFVSASKYIMHFPGLLLLLGLLSCVAAMSLKKNIKFVKYQGLGNDFILVDNTRSTEPLCDMQEAVKICNRNFGIGGF